MRADISAFLLLAPPESPPEGAQRVEVRDGGTTNPPRMFRNLQRTIKNAERTQTACPASLHCVEKVKTAKRTQPDPTKTELETGERRAFSDASIGTNPIWGPVEFQNAVASNGEFIMLFSRGAVTPMG